MKTILKKNTEGYSYKYTDLSGIHQYLENINARYIQKVERIGEDDYIFTKRCFDDKWEEEWLPGSRVVNATLSGIKNPAQEQGSALTYARRYSLLMAFGLATDDDDAQCFTIPNEPTLEDAKNYVLTFGRNKGKKLSELDENYFEWLRNNSTDNYVLKCIDLLTPQEEKENIDLRKEFVKLVQEKGIDYNEIFDKYGVENSSELTNEELKEEIERLK